MKKYSSKEAQRKLNEHKELERFTPLMTAGSNRSQITKPRCYDRSGRFIAGRY
jgi:hypothetical protein